MAIAFAKEGADVAIVYRNEHGDARETVRLVQQCGVRALRIAGDALGHLRAWPGSSRGTAERWPVSSSTASLTSVGEV